MARAANRNLGVVTSFKVGTFASVAQGQAQQFTFAQIPEQAPGGGYYDILDIELRFPASCIQFAVGAGNIVTARTLWSIFKQLSLVLGSDTPQSMWGGPAQPNHIFDSMPGTMCADFYALASNGAMLARVDGDGVPEQEIIQSGAVVGTPTLMARNEFRHRGFAFKHGPYASQTAFTTQAIDIIIPIGRRANPFSFEDVEDTGCPHNWLSGTPLGSGGVKFESALLTMLFDTQVEGGGALTITASQQVEVFVTAVIRQPGRGALPVLPVMRWNAPPNQSAEVIFCPGYHFWSGFGAADTTGRGNVDAALNVLTQSFTSFNIKYGPNVTNFATATEYLKWLETMVGNYGPVQDWWAFGVSDAALQPASMAVVRRRMGIWPVSIPLSILMSISSDTPNEISASYVAPTPTNPWQLQSVFPLYRADPAMLAARASGIPNGVPVNAVDSVMPSPAASQFIPKMVRQAVAQNAA